MNLSAILRFCTYGIAVFGLLLSPNMALGQEKDSEGLSESDLTFHELADEINEGFDYLFKTVGYGTVLRPNIDLLERHRYSISGEFRPDFSLDFRRLRLIAKPRVTITWEHWEDESDSEDESNSEDEWFVNEWLASLRLTNNLYVSYGRENLQWGPSFLISPSNPFFKDSGRSKPQTEVPGMDFTRLVWIVNPTWTISLIANLDEGRQDFLFGFERTYALKLDFTGDRKYFSLIPSKREGDRGRLGGFAGWTFTDALMLHAEMDLFYRIDPQYQLALYRSINADVDKYRDTELEGLFLIGGSYTFEAGPTLTLEYFYNGAGYTDSQADQFVGVVSSLLESQEALDETIIPGWRLFRRNYLVFQYQHTRIRNVLDLIFRYTYNLDDHSSRFTPIIKYDIGEHAQLFLVGKKNFGSPHAEFPYFFDYSFTVGLEYTF